MPVSGPKHGYFAEIVWKMEDDERSPTCEATAQFIAAAREAIPALIADLEEARFDYESCFQQLGACEKALEEAQAKLAAAEKAEGWQPIETAPFGTDLMVWKNGRVSMDYRSKEYENSWTHWMPLPTAPVAAIAAQEGK